MAVVAGTQYATRADLANLGLIGNALANVATAAQDAALAAASATADSFLQSRYELPLITWGQDLVRAVCVIAAYDVLTSRGFAPGGNVDANIRQRYLDAVGWLEAVGKGNQTPSQVTDSSTPSTGSGADGSVSATTDAYQITTADVRGWTSRGSSGGSW